MDKWLTVPPDLEPFIGTALALYSLYRAKKTLVGRNAAQLQGLGSLLQGGSALEAVT
jgi:hypothetical protein